MILYFILVFSRYVDRSFSLSEGCFPFLYDIKSKVKKLGGGWIA